MPRDLLKLSPEVEAALKEPNIDIGLSQIAKAYGEMREVIRQHYPALWPQTHAFLSAMSSLCFADFSLPVTMIAIGPSGSGKTEPLTWIMRSGSEHIIRSDSFTPKSFVSHSANIKKDDLKKIDLLPRLKDRCLCTKELAPLFAGREDDLRVAFAQLTSVLDGEGLVSSSGTQGTRGYEERIIFAWLGATTPPQNRVFQLMAALGTRLFFFSTDVKRPSASDYAAILSSKVKKANGKEECQATIKKYTSLLFESIPVRSLPFDKIKIPEPIAASIGLLTDALTRLRGSLSLGEGDTPCDDRHGAPAIEHGWRAIQVLGALAKGSALARGVRVVEADDYRFVRHVCLSSMPEYRRLTFEALLSRGGEVSALDVARLSVMAKKTAHHYLKELHILGIVESEIDEEPYRYRLKDEFRGLLDERTPSNPVTPHTERSSKIGNTLTRDNHSSKGVTTNAGVPIFEVQVGVTENDGVCLTNTKWNGEMCEKYKETFDGEKYELQPDLPKGF